MNAEFAEKMLKAKRLEAEALASLVGPEVRRVAACAVRLGADTVLAALGESEAPTRPERETRPHRRQERGPRSIVIE